MKIINLLRQIKRSFSNYTPSVEILISKENLLHNLKEHQNKYPEISFSPVLKSNAYGHGLFEVAKILDKENLPFFVVDSLYEAMNMRSYGIKSPILVIGYTSAENIRSCKLSKVAFTITSLDQLKNVSGWIKRETKIHLKIDTGMHRQGILENQIDEAIKIIKSNRLITLEGICSHFADADNTDNTFTKSQIEKWNKIVPQFKKEFPSIKFTHISATSGVSNSPKIDANVARLGIGLYGIKQDPKSDLDLKPVLEIKTIISGIKTIPANEHVGYSITYKNETPTTIATLPVGYFEGVDRRLSSVGAVKIRNEFCPIVGRVSMNITTIDISKISDTILGDEVIVISKNKEDKNSIENIAKLAGTIPYEILVHIPQSLRRKVI